MRYFFDDHFGFLNKLLALIFRGSFSCLAVCLSLDLLRVSRNIFQGNGYAISAKATSDFIIYSCVSLSFACMSFVHYLHNSKNKKRGDRSYFA